MTDKLPISAFIITLNEVDRIADCVNAIKDLVDEVIVIDCGSIDDTVSVAEFHGAKVMHNDWPGYGLQKRFGEDQCYHNWVLNLDADEVMTASLAEEIKQKFADGSITQHHGWYLDIVEMLPGQDTPSSYAHITKAVRLYDRREGRYAESTVHDRVHFLDISTTGEFKNIVEHRSSRGLTHSVHKLNYYSGMQADNAISRGKTTLVGLRLLVEFPLAFLKAYILRLYFLQGLQGFVNAKVYAFSRFLRLAKIIEKKSNW